MMTLPKLIARLQEQQTLAEKEGRSPHRVLVCADRRKGWKTEMELDFAADTCGGSDFIILRWTTED